MEADQTIHCSFCGKSPSDVLTIIAGPDNHCICNECVMLCEDIIVERGGEIDWLHALRLPDLPTTAVRVMSLTAAAGHHMTCRYCKETCEVYELVYPSPTKMTSSTPEELAKVGGAFSLDELSGQPVCLTCLVRMREGYVVLKRCLYCHEERPEYAFQNEYHICIRCICSGLWCLENRQEIKTVLRAMRVLLMQGYHALFDRVVTAAQTEPATVSCGEAGLTVLREHELLQPGVNTLEPWLAECIRRTCASDGVTFSITSIAFPEENIVRSVSDPI